MGDKAVARETMRRAGLEPIPGSRGAVQDEAEARGVAEAIGYPVLLKASGGGGGRGMRVARDGGALDRAFAEARMEAEKAFGNRELYLEKYIEGGRHIEFQILADTYGNAVHLGERECSVQRNHQKLVEEAPSPVLTGDARREMGERVAAAVARVGYVNAGTVEFFREPGGKLYFMEMNTRLQVEHPVTEMITGVDIVKEQVGIAANRPLSLRQEDVSFAGHAIEVRINAEDPAEGFRPTPGRIDRFDAPTGEGIRIDTHVRAGYVVPPFYDSMIAKLIAHAPDRNAAIERLTGALRAFGVEGVKTTIPLHLAVLATEEFRSGNYDTGLIARMFAGKEA
jgi:acetyl-CoA carboxylase biotin carboxylase subunit